MKRPYVPTVLLLVVAAATLAFTAGRSAPPQPVIAFVDMERVIAGLDENAAKSQELNEYGAKFEQNLKDEAKRIEADKEAIKLLPEGPEKRAKLEDVYRREIQLEANLGVSRRLVNRRKLEALADLYRKVEQAAEEIAKARGYTMVLASDESIEIPTSSAEDFQRAVALKRALYIDSRHDITEEVVTYMNNQFAAAGGKAPAKSAATGASKK